MFLVEITEPPSLNGAYYNVPGRGRRLCASVRQWKKDTAWLIALRVPAASRITGPYTVTLQLPEKMRGDADNRLKIALDALVASGRVPDDSKATDVRAIKTEALQRGVARLIVRATSAGSRREAAA